MTDVVRDPQSPPQGVDPDPVAIGFSILALISSGASYLETRRTNRLQGNEQRQQFRAAWFAARRTLLQFRRQLEVFELLVEEHGIEGREFRLGAVRLVVDRRQHAEIRRLHREVLTTANELARRMDELSAFLDRGYDEAIARLPAELNMSPSHDSYEGLIATGRRAYNVFEQFIEDVGDREGFTGPMDAA